jgi:hypothetical protein
MTNYIQFCEDGATMAMQHEGWMIATLFSHWISHFIQALQKRGWNILWQQALTDYRWPQLARDYGGCVQGYGSWS